MDYMHKIFHMCKRKFSDMEKNIGLAEIRNKLRDYYELNEIINKIEYEISNPIIVDGFISFGSSTLNEISLDETHKFNEQIKQIYKL